jgi:hypothetical protein
MFGFVSEPFSEYLHKHNSLLVKCSNLTLLWGIRALEVYENLYSHTNDTETMSLFSLQKVNFMLSGMTYKCGKVSLM